MKIEKSYPPNFMAINAEFDVYGKEVLYAYGDTIFNPLNVEITPPLLRHEVTHLLQQKEIGVDAWWRQYIDDPQFRLWQEIPAHQNEFLTHLDSKPNRHARRGLIVKIAKRLSGPLYGNLISLQEAKQLLSLERIKDHQ